MAARSQILHPTRALRALYSWTLSWAESRYGAIALAGVAIAESIFFPIPPDILLLALCLGRPVRSYRFAAICTAGSVLGGVVGWLVGSLFWGQMGVPPDCPELAGGGFFVDHVPGVTCERLAAVKRFSHEHAFVGIFTSALTPIPYKVFTLAGGAFRVDLLTFVAASALGRGGRFFLVAFLVRRYGEATKRLLDRHLEWFTIAVAVVVIVAGLALGR